MANMSRRRVGGGVITKQILQSSFAYQADQRWTLEGDVKPFCIEATEGWRREVDRLVTVARLLSLHAAF